MDNTKSSNDNKASEKSVSRCVAGWSKVKPRTRLENFSKFIRPGHLVVKEGPRSRKTWLKAQFVIYFM